MSLRHVAVSADKTALFEGRFKAGAVALVDLDEEFSTLKGVVSASAEREEVLIARVDELVAIAERQAEAAGLFADIAEDKPETVTGEIPAIIDSEGHKNSLVENAVAVLEAGQLERDAAIETEDAERKALGMRVEALDAAGFAREDAALAREICTEELKVEFIETVVAADGIEVGSPATPGSPPEISHPPRELPSPPRSDPLFPPYPPDADAGFGIFNGICSFFEADF